MNPEATDYSILADAGEEASIAPALDTLRELLRLSSAALTRQEILDRWPTPATLPTVNTLWRWLARACDIGMLLRTGAGSKADAFRYRLAMLPEPATLEPAPNRSANPLATPAEALDAITDSVKLKSP